MCPTRDVGDLVSVGCLRAVAAGGDGMVAGVAGGCSLFGRATTMLFILAGVLAVYQVFEHLDVVPAMTSSSALDDLLVGWPMAGVLAVTGAIVHGT